VEKRARIRNKRSKGERDAAAPPEEDLLELCDPIYKAIMTASRAAEAGDDEESSRLWWIADAVLEQHIRLARAGDQRAISRVIRIARELTEEFSELAKLYPEVCRCWLRPVLTMPALLSPLPRVGTRYKAILKNMEVGAAQSFSNGKWDYHNPVNRLVAQWIEEILEISSSRHVLWADQYFTRRIGKVSFAKFCSKLPPFSKKPDSQAQWFLALERFLEIRSDDFDLHKLPQFHFVRRRARVNSKDDNARLFEDECRKEIRRALKSLAPAAA
jgi:hypothetical protein